MSIRKVVPISKRPIAVIDMKGIEAEYFSSSGPYAFYITRGGNLALMGMIPSLPERGGGTWGFIHYGQAWDSSPGECERFYFRSDTPRGAITKAMEGDKREVFVANTMREVALHWADHLRGTL